MNKYLSPFIIFLFLTSSLLAQWRTIGDSLFTNGPVSSVAMTLIEGVPYVAFNEDNGMDKLTVMRFKYNRWQVVGFRGISSGAARYIDIASDGKHPIVAYVNDISNNWNGKVTVRRFDGSTWRDVGPVVMSGGNASNTSVNYINNSVVVGLSDGNNNDLMVVKSFDGQRWNIIDQAFPHSPSSSVNFNGLVENDGKLYAAMANKFNDRRIRCYEFETGKWEEFMGLSPDSFAKHVNLDFIGNIPFVSYEKNQNSVQKGLHVKKFENLTWTTLGKNDYAPYDAIGPKMLTEDSIVFVVHQKNTFVPPGSDDFAMTNNLRMLRYDGTDWIETGKNGFSQARSSSYDIASDTGFVYVAYRDDWNGGALTLKRVKIPKEWKPPQPMDSCALEANFNINDVCFGDEIKIEETSLDTNHKIINWLWDFGNGTTSYRQNPEPFVYSDTGKYTIQLVVINDRRRPCVDTLIKDVHVKTAPFVELPGDQVSCEDNLVRIKPKKASRPFYWDDGSEELEREIIVSGTYWIEAENECGYASDSVQIELIKCGCNILLPNSFTPNNDGLNDEYFMTTDCDITHFEIQFFNKWGEPVFSSNNQFFRWNGRHNGRTLPADVYSYKIYCAYMTESGLEFLDEFRKVRILR